MTGNPLRKLVMADFDYELPEDLIAQEPLNNRSGSRLLVLERESGDISHRAFEDLPGLLRPGDLLVMNDSRVIPARLAGRRDTGGDVEFLLLRELAAHHWECLMRPARRLRIGEVVAVAGKDHGSSAPATATVIEKRGDGQGIVRLDAHLWNHLESYGRVPLPPYIHVQLDDDERYQTVYARDPGSAAAPTAGLHFTEAVLERLRERGVECVQVTLHVGLDTFRPVVSEYAEDHVIHSEWCSVPEETALALASARKRQARIVAVGTTTARTLETYGAWVGGRFGAAYSGLTRMYITPGHHWTVVDAMVTNFHLPKSSLLLMMSSFAGKSALFEAYRQAIERRYRFFSFGDAMFIE